MKKTGGPKVRAHISNPPFLKVVARSQLQSSKLRVECFEFRELQHPKGGGERKRRSVI